MKLSLVLFCGVSVIFSQPTATVNPYQEHRTAERKFYCHCKPNTTQAIGGSEGISQRKAHEPHRAKVD